MQVANHAALWEKIKAFNIDDGSPSLTFEARLARENDWSIAFAQRVVAEYKKFLFLAKVAGHQVTPSEEIDQAWHLHMLYTKSYWDRLCRDVLGFDLDHEPTKGGQSEGDKFVDWYERTKDSYRKFFGERPPRDIWPDTKDRFASAPHMKRIDTSANLVTPRDAATKRARRAGILLIALVVSGALALFAAFATGGLPLGVTVGVLAAITILAIIMFVVAVPREVRHPSKSAFTSRRRDGSSGCGAFIYVGDTTHHHHGHSGCSASPGHSGCSAAAGHSGCSSGGASGSDGGGSSGCGSSGCGGGGGGD